MKEIHINSLENLLKRKEDDIDRMKNMIYQNANTNNNNRQTETSQMQGNTNTNTNQNYSYNPLTSNENYLQMMRSTNFSAGGENIQNTNSNTNTEFVRNEENENELKKMINNYNNNSKDLNTSTASNKIPGKIYKKKK